ncbi:MAG: signal recognition particle protein, partial [Clostridia bacterium]|nr:signal recognition particle protein [Clostridia bacterium]
KTDGDTRGGAALSVKAVTGTPIKLIGTGEKLDALEPFHPGRMASRILGMGDMLTLIEKAQQQVDEKKAHELEQKIRSNSFDFNDFLDNLRQLRSMGPIKSVIEMLPGIGSQLKDVDIDEKQFYRSEAIITSMTGRERQKPELINPSRKRRIAAGSGTRVEDVNRLLKQFAEMQKMMKQMGSMKKSKRRPFMPFH